MREAHLAGGAHGLDVDGRRGRYQRDSGLLEGCIHGSDASGVSGPPSGETLGGRELARGQQSGGVRPHGSIHGGLAGYRYGGLGREGNGKRVELAVEGVITAAGGRR